MNIDRQILHIKVGTSQNRRNVITFQKCISEEPTIK